MPRVQISSQAWGVVLDNTGTAVSTTPTLATTAGAAASVYTTATGSTAVSSLATDSDGRIPGFVEEGTYTLTVSGVAYQVEAVSGRPAGVVNAQSYGAQGDGVTDDTAAITAALAALPAYASGRGGGTVVLPATTANDYVVSSTITLTSGQRLIGASESAPRLRGNFAGSTITVADGAQYVTVENLTVENQNTNVLARAMTAGNGGNTSNLLLRRCTFLSRNVAGPIVYWKSVIVSTVDHCFFGGIVTASCECGLQADVNCNNIRVLGSSFSDTRSGLQLLQLAGAEVRGTQFEALAGGATRNGGLVIDGVSGGSFTGNYFESIPSNGIVVYNGIGATRGLVVGGNFMLNTASPFINVSNATQCTVLSNHFTPGANAANADGVSAGTGNVVFEQFLASGSGVPVTGTSILLSSGNIAAATVGKGLRVKEGSNAKQGVATLVGGTVTVANTSVTANSRIFLSRSTTGGTAGHLSSTLSAGTSFTINSSSGTDTSTINWQIFEPA